MAMRTRPHPGDFIRNESIEPSASGVAKTRAAAALHVRGRLFQSPARQGGFSGHMAPADGQGFPRQ